MIDDPVEPSPLRLPREHWCAPLEFNSFEIAFLMGLMAYSKREPKVDKLFRKLASAKSLLDRRMSDD
jgi:hypothetical protein